MYAAIHVICRGNILCDVDFAFERDVVEAKRRFVSFHNVLIQYASLSIVSTRATRIFWGDMFDMDNFQYSITSENCIHFMLFSIRCQR